MSDEPFLGINELLPRLGHKISKSTIYRMAALDQIPSVLIGPKLGGRRFQEGPVREALSRLTRPPRPYHPPRKAREAVADQVGEMAQ